MPQPLREVSRKSFERATGPETPSDAAPKAQPHASPQPGDRVRWLGRCWVIEAVYYHPRFGYFYRVRGEEDSAYELISADGNDGKLEVLAA